MKQTVIVLFLLAVLAPAQEMLRVEETADAMGSTYTVVAYGSDRARLIGAVEQSFEEVRRIDHLLSNYRPDSELSQVNRFAAQRPVEVSQETFDLLAACQEYSRLSDGAFDISVGPLMKLWGFYRGSGRLPHRAEVLGVLERVGYRKILLDPARRTVRFAREGMELDPGGIGKGYAVDRIVSVLQAAGVGAALVSAGGSSIYALGAPPGEKGWKVKIRDPRNSAKTAEEVVLSNASLSTSGNYEKFFRAEGRIFSHIMDPRTGYPAPGMLAVSVIAPRTLDSEAWTKPFFINGRQWAAQHKPAGFRVFLCEDRGEQPCAWLQ
jgi:thiamine biosynthesis lipoprotein